MKRMADDNEILYTNFKHECMRASVIYKMYNSVYIPSYEEGAAQVACGYPDTQTVPAGQHEAVETPELQHTSSAAQKVFNSKPALQKTVPAAPQRAVDEAPGPNSPPQVALALH